jgi:hypothetical protein
MIPWFFWLTLWSIAFNPPPGLYEEAKRGNFID